MNVVKRATTLADKHIDIIIDAVSNGIPTRRILDQLGVGVGTWYDKLAADKALAERYARAKQDAADALADEIQSIADQAPEKAEGRVDSGWAQWQRTRIDAKKWIAAKLKPKSYGDSQLIEHSGEIKSIIARYAERPEAKE